MAYMLATKDDSKHALVLRDEELGEIVSQMLSGGLQIENSGQFVLDIARVVAKYSNGKLLNERLGPGVYAPQQAVLGGGPEFWIGGSVLDPIIDKAPRIDVDDINFTAAAEREINQFLKEYEASAPHKDATSF